MVHVKVGVDLKKKKSFLAHMTEASIRVENRILIKKIAYRHFQDCHGPRFGAIWSEKWQNSVLLYHALTTAPKKTIFNMQNHIRPR